MKILALRVKQVGRFSEPVAVEGFANGVTVFTGDNETGKSTLFTALQTAFAMPYNCLLYTSQSPRDRTRSRMPSSA